MISWMVFLTEILLVLHHAAPTECKVLNELGNINDVSSYVRIETVYYLYSCDRKPGCTNYIPEVYFGLHITLQCNTSQQSLGDSTFE